MKSLCQSVSRKIGAGLILCLTALVSGMLKQEKPDGWILSAEAKGKGENRGSGASSLMVWVYNYANISTKALGQAEEDLGRILQRAGVRIEWVDCPSTEEEAKTNSNCQERMSPLTLGLILRSKYADQTNRNKGANPYGSAELLASGHDSHYIYLYSEIISDPFFRHGLPEYQLLSLVAAHELGHILLRTSVHSNTGIMQARLKKADWDNASWGRLLFTSEQAEIIRTEIATRQNLQMRSATAIQTAGENR